MPCILSMLSISLAVLRNYPPHGYSSESLIKPLARSPSECILNHNSHCACDVQSLQLFLGGPGALRMLVCIKLNIAIRDGYDVVQLNSAFGNKNFLAGIVHHRLLRFVDHWFKLSNDPRDIQARFFLHLSSEGMLDGWILRINLPAWQLEDVGEIDFMGSPLQQKNAWNLWRV